MVDYLESHVNLHERKKNKEKNDTFVVSHLTEEVICVTMLHLFLAWRAMEDRISNIGYVVESHLWGDSRARHTYLIASTDEHPLLLIEIDMGDHRKGIRKSMKLNKIDLQELPSNIIRLIYIGETSRPDALDNLLQAAETFVTEHPNYNFYSNNCRTFAEYIIDQMPEFRDVLPRKKGSILEYYHSQAINEHPGTLIRTKKFLKDVRDFHRHNRQYLYAGKLVLDVQLPKPEYFNDDQIIETRL